MFYRNENETSELDNKNPNDPNTQNTQPIGNNIDPLDLSIYDNEPFQCPFDMDRLNTDGDPGRYPSHHPMPHHQPHRPCPYNPNVYYIIHHHYYHNRRTSDGRW